MNPIHWTKCRPVVALLGALFFVSLATACKHEHEGHDHSAAHPEGHDHHEEGHGHGDAPTVAFTRWSDQFELFAEHSPGVVGQPLSFLLHVTVLDGFRALEQAKLTLELEGPSALSGESAVAIRPGIFQIEVTPEIRGHYKGKLRIAGEVQGVVEGIELRVFSEDAEADDSIPEADHEGLIEFLKEQQWGVPFQTAFVHTGVVVASVEVAGRVSTPPGGTADLGAPVTGRLVAPPGGLPRPGTKVKKGQVLATLMPAPSSPEAGARAGFAVAEAEARVSAAQTAFGRAERLIRDEAISKRELEDARREVRVAEESLSAARRAAQLYSGATGSSGRGSWRLAAPIDGTLVSVRAMPGATVSPGETLFRIVDARELWIVAQVPEQDAARLRIDRDASFQVAGLDVWSPIQITGKAPTASVVMLGRTVDPVSRTVDVIYALGAPDASLRVGGLVQVSLPAGDEFKGVVVPRSALVNQEGRDAIYVQVDGEHFQERLVRLGPRSGAQVGLLGGVRSGERIVTNGAHLVRLADRANSGQAHGHIH